MSSVEIPECIYCGDDPDGCDRCRPIDWGDDPVLGDDLPPPDPDEYPAPSGYNA